MLRQQRDIHEARFITKHAWQSRTAAVAAALASDSDVRTFDKGIVRIALFNFKENQVPVEATIRISHLRRRFM